MSLTEGFTVRELQVLKGICAGWSSKQIGAHLGIAANTVDTHRHHLRNKLGVHSAAEMVKFAQKNGLDK